MAGFRDSGYHYMQSSSLSFAFFCHLSRGALGLDLIPGETVALHRWETSCQALAGQLGPTAYPWSWGRSAFCPSCKAEAILPEEGRVDLEPAKAIESSAKAPPSLTF